MSDAPAEPAFATIAIVGAGAVGGFFGAMLARAGLRVTLVARAAQVEAIARDGLRLAMGGRTEVLRTVSATTDLAGALADADLVLVCVKSTDTEGLARAMAPHVRAGAAVMSLQNGVENAAVLARHVGACATVVPAVVYVATAMPEPGLVQHHGRGDLVIGALHGAPVDAQHAARLEAIVAVFARAAVPVRISEDPIRSAGDQSRPTSASGRIRISDPLPQSWSPDGPASTAGTPEARRRRAVDVAPPMSKRPSPSGV